MWDRITASINKPLFFFWIAYLGIGILLTLIFFVWMPQARYESAVEVSKHNAHAVQLAIERFSVDSSSGYYPHDFAEVIAGGYLSKPIINPFTGQPIKVVTDPADASAGDVVYTGIADRYSKSNQFGGYELTVTF